MLYTKVVEHLEVFLTVIGGIVWLVRLEGKVDANEKANTRTQSAVDATNIEVQAINSKVLEKISQIQQAVAKIEGMLEAKNDGHIQ
jgi:hypothetical protein